MSDKRPTSEQVMEFWQWCGFKQDRQFDSIYYLPEDYQKYVKLSNFPTDLNGLFRYAVPKVVGMYYFVTLSITTRTNVLSNATNPIPREWVVEIQHIRSASNDWDKKIYESKSDNPALALFWAIWQVVQEGKK